MADNFNLLKKISETPGAPGFEDKIRELVKSELAPLVDSLSTDNLGNLIAYKKGSNGKKLMLAAHMDEIGFIISHIDENGFARFHPLGGFDPKTLTAQRVIAHGRKDIVGVMGSKPIHIMSAEERTKAVKIEDFFIDFGMSKDELAHCISIGDSVTRERELIEMGSTYNGKSLDNRISVYVLIEALRLLKGQKHSYDIYAVFTTQEEVGLRGAHGATLSIQPDVAIAVDTTIAYDVPGSSPHEQVTKLGAGPAIKIMDSSVIAHRGLVEFMKKTAESKNIGWQPEILPAGGTDTAVLQKLVKGGAKAGAVSIPTRHIHQVIETVSKRDVEDAIILVAALIEDMADF
jgi:tetrahedral aminopeptidase